jgi:hypothetical protein
MELSGGPEMAAAANAVTPMPTPPHPGTAVNALARAIASRMKRRFASACAWIGSGCGNGNKDFIAQSLVGRVAWRLTTGDWRLTTGD